MELQNQLENKYTELKKEMQLDLELEELDDIFFIRDYINQAGFVSEKLSRQICLRITDTFNSWASYLHGIIMPNPHNMINNTESQLFSEDEKQEIIQLMNEILAHTTKNVLNGLKKDKENEADFIRTSVDFWNNKLNPQMIKIIEKVNKYWIEKATESN